MTNPSQPNKQFIDHNATLKVGMRVDGVFTRKLDFGMVVAFKVDGKPCSGVLLVANFPSNEREMRDRMFEVAAVGMPAPGLVITSILPPKDGSRFTRIRLCARPRGENGRVLKRPGLASEKGRRRSKNAAVRKQAAITSGASQSAIPVGSIDGKMAPLPLPMVAAGTVVGHEVASTFAPVVVTADPVTAARMLCMEAQMPARSCGLAELGRTMAIARAAGDPELSALLGSMDSHLNQFDALCVDEGVVRSRLSKDVLPLASALYSIRAQKSELDAATAVLKQESARYAGLCGKIKRAGANVPTELQSQADEMKAAIDGKRASLKEAYAANKKADDDADFGLIISLSAPDIAAARDEAVEIAGALAGIATKRAQLVKELGGMVDAYEKRLTSRS